MNKIPFTDASPVIRTDFTDDAAWDSLRRAIEAPSEIESDKESVLNLFRDVTGTDLTRGFTADVAFLSDPKYDGLTPDQIRELVPEEPDRVMSFLFIVDRMTLTHADRPILVLDLLDEPGRTFRVIPSEMWAVENSLSLANCDWEDFSGHVDPDGIFRGHPESQE